MTEVGLMIFSRAMQVAFINMRIIRAGRFMPRIAGAAVLVAGVSAAVAFPAGSAVAQASATRTPAYTRTFVVTRLGNAGPGSLRAAINSANASAGDSTLISFAVNGTITLASPLPAIARKVAIDATSAPTYVSGGPPVVALDFNGHPGLLFAVGSGGSELLGVAVDDASGNGVTVDSHSVTLNDNYIGLNLAGAAAGNGNNGVYVSATSAGDFIGLNGSGDAGVVANVISGNRGSGIALVGSSANTVVANRIGTNAAGTSAIANLSDGIWITQGSRGNEIGGTAFTDTATGDVNNPTGSKGTVTPVFVVPDGAFARISDVETPPGLLAVLDLPTGGLAAALAGPGPVLLLAGVSDPGNAGTLVRSAEAFGAVGVLFGRGGVDPYSPKVVRAAMGSLFRLPLAVVEPEELLAAAAAAGRLVVATDTTGDDLDPLALPADPILAVGNERRGVRDWLPRWDRAVRIPQSAQTESLNAAVAGSILLYAFARARPGAVK